MSASQSPVALVVGASRGIGRQVAIDLAKNGYRVVVAAKTTSDPYAKDVTFPPDPNSPQSTISTVKREIEEAGGTALAVQVDTRDPSSINAMVASTVSAFGQLDVLVYNTGAIWWASVENTPLKRFQLLQRVNPEGLYATIQAALPVFKENGWKARVVVVSPPIYSRFFKGKTGYAIGKVGMSVLTKGLAMDWKREGKTDMTITSIWPAAAIQSAATETANLADLRHPSIFSDAILQIIQSSTEEVNGELVLDEDFLRSKGVKDFSKYSLVQGATPRRIMPVQLPDLTVAEQDDEGQRMDSTKRKAKI